MYIPNVTTQNYPIYRLQFVVETFGQTQKKLNNQNSIKDPIVVTATNKKT